MKVAARLHKHSKSKSALHSPSAALNSFLPLSQGGPPSLSLPNDQGSPAATESQGSYMVTAARMPCVINYCLTKKPVGVGEGGLARTPRRAPRSAPGWTHRFEDNKFTATSSKAPAIFVQADLSHPPQSLSESAWDFVALVSIPAPARTNPGVSAHRNLNSLTASGLVLPTLLVLAGELHVPGLDGHN